ncbi:MAG: response regulator transcription factor [Bacteroidetes bacterium]|jgi:DNA-binding NarL/FixJ family response regulator|nr:MAG: response regulator transcription factor [Bacteroidota bacterium]
MKNNPTIALADDHVLLRKGLADLVSKQGYTVLFQADNGEELLDKLKTNPEPDVVLLDINMPKKDGYETALWLKRNKPGIKVLALSMYDDEKAIIRMLKNGARGYILKDAEPSDLKSAIESVLTRGFHYSEMVTGKLIHSINAMSEEDSEIKSTLGLSEKEITFLKLAATELTYKEIAEQMHLSPRTIDGYRDELFEKLDLKSRVGLVLFAIKNGIVNIQ